MSSPAKAKARQSRAPALATWRIGVGPPPQGPFLALVPGADVPLIALTLPDALRGTARQDVARRQVVDRLGGKAQDLDIRAADFGAGGAWTRVAVADRAQVLRWRSEIGAGAARCRGIMPDYAALPTAPGLWTLALDGDTLRARLGPDDGFSAEKDLAAAMLLRALKNPPRAVLWLGPRDADLMAVLGGLPAHGAIGELPSDLRPQEMAYGEGALNFARDPQSDVQGIERRLRHALWPALLVVLGAASWSAAQMLATRQDQTAERQILAQSESAARRDLLGDVPILDLRLQVAREIDARRGQRAAPPQRTTALDLLRHATSVLSDGEIEVQTVSLGNAVDGVLIDGIATDFRALDLTLAALISAGLDATILRSAIDPEGGVTASFGITGMTP